VTSRASESLAREDRLLRRPDYQRCYRSGKRLWGDLATLHVLESPEGRCRLGVTATRKVGGSVVRQRLRRRTREIFRRWPERHRLPHVDIVVHLRPGSGSSSFDELRTQLEGQLRRVLSRG